MFGETDGGGLGGGASLTAGVNGGSICPESWPAVWRRGDDDCGAKPLQDRPLEGLSYEEARNRAISSSARPRLMRGRSASEVNSRPFCLDRRTDDSRDEI